MPCSPKLLAAIFSLCLFAALSCSHEITPPEPPIESIDYDGIGNIVYSQHIQPIFNQKCTSAGCHNSLDRQHELDLTSWESLIRGAEHGACIIAGNAEHSLLIEHVKGEIEPRMPFNREPLPEKVIHFLERWIDEGAKNDAGQKPFEGITKKVYVTNQGDDLISVLALEHNLVIRLIEVGNVPNLPEVPHNITVDKQKQFWYVTLISGGELWKFDVATDAFQGKVKAGRSPANVVVSPDGSRACVTDWNTSIDNESRTVHVIETASMTRIGEWQVGIAPHGINFSHDGQYLYVANNLSSSVSILRSADGELIDQIVLAADVNPLVRSTKYQPLQVVLTPDDRFAYVSCYNSNEVRVIDTSSRQVVHTIAVGAKPYLLQLTPDGKYVYVANWGSNNVSVIDAASYQVINTIESPDFASPHDVVFTSDGRYAYVTNQNRDGSFSSHHPTEPGEGKIGNVVIIDTATRQVIKTVELEVDPTGVAVVER
jgi:YVTN family beta-propeller protein